MRSRENCVYCASTFFINARCLRVSGGNRRFSVETLLLSEKIQVERKQFFFDLKENPRGRFLKITEDVGGRRDAIIIPATGLEDFRAMLEQVIQVDRQAAVPAES